jgi:ABC-2 type transport system permease protein
MNGFKLFFVFLYHNIRSQLIYTSNFLIGAVGVFALSILPILNILVLKNKFTNINGWSFYEIIFIVGLNQISSALWIFFFSEMLGIDNLIRYGWLDRLLLRPRNLLLSISTRSFTVSSIGILLSGIISVTYSFVHLQKPMYYYLILLPLIFSSFVVYSCIFLLASTISFWNTQSSVVTSLIEDMHHNFNQYPLQIYAPIIQVIMTFIVPLGLVGNYPAEIIFNKESLMYPKYIVLIVIIWILLPYITYKSWAISLKKYSSAGSN